MSRTPTAGRLLRAMAWAALAQQLDRAARTAGRRAVALVPEIDETPDDLIGRSKVTPDLRTDRSPCERLLGPGMTA